MYKEQSPGDAFAVADVGPVNQTGAILCVCHRIKEFSADIVAGK